MTGRTRGRVTAGIVWAVLILSGCRTGPGDLKDDAPGFGPPRIRFDEATYRIEGDSAWAVFRVREEQELCLENLHLRRHETHVILQFPVPGGPAALSTSGNAVRAVVIDYDTVGESVFIARDATIAFEQVTPAGWSGTLHIAGLPALLPGRPSADAAGTGPRPTRTLRGFFRLTPGTWRLTRFVERAREAVVRTLLSAPERAALPGEAVYWLESSAAAPGEPLRRTDCVEALGRMPSGRADEALRRLMRMPDPLIAPAARAAYRARLDRNWW